MIVCVCRRVSDREITRHAQAGMSFDDIQFELGVAHVIRLLRDELEAAMALCGITSLEALPEGLVDFSRIAGEPLANAIDSHLY